MSFESLKKRKYAFVLLAFALILTATACSPQQTAVLENKAGQVQDLTPSATEAGIAAQEKAAAGGAGRLAVTFLDVGQGNCVLAEWENEYMLIDGGNRETSSFVVSYLKKQNIEKLNYALISHYDADHLNGVVGALNVFDCDLVISPDYKTDSRVYHSYVSVTEEKEIPVVHPRQGEAYTLGEAEFSIVGPLEYGHSDENEDSVGLRLVYGDTSFLICGDASKKSEEEMLSSGQNLKSDVYLASHHGSDTSSSDAFLEAVAPEYVVISAGMSNSYGHPSLDTMERIKKTGAKLYRTDLQGTVTAVSDGTNITFSPEPCVDYRSGRELDGTEEKGSGKNSQDLPEDGSGLAAQVNPQSLLEEETDTSGTGTKGLEEAYILNKKTKKFHRPDCSSVSTIKEENMESYTGTSSQLQAEGYSPCQRCNP